MSWSALFMTFIRRLGLKNMPQEQREGSDLVLNILISFFPQCLSFGFRVQSHFKSMTPRQHILEFRARVFLVIGAPPEIEALENSISLIMQGNMIRQYQFSDVAPKHRFAGII